MKNARYTFLLKYPRITRRKTATGNCTGESKMLKRDFSGEERQADTLIK